MYNLLRMLSKRFFTNARFSTDVGNQQLLLVSEKAAKQLQKIAAPDEHLRISVDSGGCSGFEYKMELGKEIDKEEDEIIRIAAGAMLVVDKTSLEFLRGAKLDYVEDLMRSAFRITENPKATSGCSCGASFAPKEENL